jgi:hypothetical protein
MSRMRNLTLASAKHLLSQGHITPAHHQRIVAAAMAAPKLPTAPKMPKMPKPPVGFGSLGKAAGMLPQQAQAPIPTNVGDIGASIPAGTSSDY